MKPPIDKIGSVSNFKNKTIQKPENTKILWNIAFLFIAFIFIDHFLVMISFLTYAKLLPFVFPVSLFASIFVSLYLGSKAGLKRPDLFLPTLISLLVIFSSLIISALFFDFSWDGQWYHQDAIYQINDGWNPIFEPMKRLHLSIVHFPKGSWYFAASVYSTFGCFEAGKCNNLIVSAALILVVYTTSLEYGFSKFKSLLLTTLLVLNPVLCSQLTTYLVDGLLTLYLTIYGVSIFACINNPDLKKLSIGVMSAVCLINTKFTGLVFFGVFASFAFLYFLFWKREYLLKFVGVHAVTLILSVFVFGFNPYVTNTLERGHPLYPIMGTAKYPSQVTPGNDSNEIYETPGNLQGKSIITRYFYACFGRPSNAPYGGNRNAELIWPCTSKITDWGIYRFHAVRISGLGPFFGGTLILSFIIGIWVFFTFKEIHWAFILTIAAIIATLLLSKHFWWARFAPQIWWLPIIPVLFLFYQPIGGFRAITTWMLTTLIVLNGIIVLYVHLNWETKASIHLRKQLTELKQNNKTIEVSFNYFKRATEERLLNWGIKYIEVSDQEIRQGKYQELTSVVEGYPGAIQFRVIDK
jgi:hypothetical protein